LKVCLLADTHFGVRGDSDVFLEYFSRFFQNTFFPYLKENGIDTVIHLGDLVDRRKYISYTTSNVMRKSYVEPSCMLGLTTHIIAGNHDCFYKDTNEINALRELIVGKDNFKVYSNPSSIELDGLRCQLLPWICADNMDQSMEAIKNKNDVVFGHLELSGFEMAKGQMMDHGMDAKLFKKFKGIYSGHYHHKSDSGNIHYLGTPYEMTWADYNDPKGFHILDTDTLELTFIENPERMFVKVNYDNGRVDVDEVDGKIVKLIIHDKQDVKKFDKYVKSLGDVDIKVIDEHLNFDASDSKKIDVENITDTLQILTEYVDNLDVNVDKERLNTLLRTLYMEAQIEN
jgi:DNA repair exonuclease SbcCD nuclease subunit